MEMRGLRKTYQLTRSDWVRRIGERRAYPRACGLTVPESLGTNTVIDHHTHSGYRTCK